MAKTLATFRIEDSDWEAFKKWADSKGSNASSELVKFVLTCLGRIDSGEPLTPAALSDRIGAYLDANLDDRFEKSLNYNLEKRIEDCIDISLEQRIEKYLDNNLDDRNQGRIEESLDNRIEEKLGEA